MSDVVDWLMEGDPAIRWQVMRDLLDACPGEWQEERQKVARQGWGAQFLKMRNEDGNWRAGRWTGTVWTLLLMLEIGMPPRSDLENTFDLVACRLLPKGEPVSERTLFKEMDLCHLGFWLGIGSRFSPCDERLRPIADAILGWQFADGGWNCRKRMVPRTSHGSFHTTFNVLDGLREATDAGIVDRDVFEKSEARAVEFMLQHQMYRSDKTGKVVSERFTHLSYPSFWHYTVLRGLDYLRGTPGIRDPRLADPLDLIEGRRKPNGRWVVEHRIPGDTLFDMEAMGKESRWNTLRAMRVLRRAGRA